MKRLTTIIPSILLASTLLHSDVGIDSVGANIGLSWIQSTQTDNVGSISFAHQPDEFYGHLELYSLFSGVFHDKSYKPSLNIIGNINGDFNNALLLAGINKYFEFKHYNLYGGALIGGGILEWKYNPLVATDIQKQDTSSPVGALQVGGEYELSNNILLTLNAKFYLHNYATSIKSNATNDTEVAHKTSESISIGIRIPFGSSSIKSSQIPKMD